MNPVPIFHFYSGNTLIAEVPLPHTGEVSVATTECLIGEMQICSFVLEPSEPDLQYLLRTGDMVADYVRDAPPQGHPGEARIFRGSAQWDSGLYFDSARGDTVISLFSRATDDAPWRPRSEIHIRVVPTKLGEDRYEAMYLALSRLSLSFVQDLISKSAAQLGLESGDVRTPVQSPQVRLRLIENIWTALAPILSRVERSPVAILQRTYGPTQIWGSESLRSRSLCGLAERGFAAAASALPVKATASLLTESCDTFEHRTIKGFLRLLLAHLAECADDARSNATALRADATMLRDFPDALLSIEQRIDKLERAIASAEVRDSQIRFARASTLLAPLHEEIRPKRTPVFENVMPYRRIWGLIQRYSDNSAVIVGSDVHQRVKATWKMYEQWVFFQLAAAIRRLGFWCEEEIGVLQRKSRYRFTLDLDFGSRLSFVNSSRDVVTITYQPLIHGYSEAVSRRDTLFRGGSVTAPWSPDVLIEVLDQDREPGRSPRVRHALVVDAKYSSRVSKRHWDQVWRYTEIRSTATRAAVVKQVWVAYPAQHPEIVPRDEFVDWGSKGPTAADDETVLGAIGLIPHTLEEPVTGDPIGDEPSPILLQFLGGMFARFGIDAIKPGD